MSKNGIHIESRLGDSDNRVVLARIKVTVSIPFPSRIILVLFSPGKIVGNDMIKAMKLNITANL